MTFCTVALEKQPLPGGGAAFCAFWSNLRDPATFTHSIGRPDRMFKPNQPENTLIPAVSMEDSF
jgi:hypothetical protein